MKKKFFLSHQKYLKKMSMLSLVIGSILHEERCEEKKIFWRQKNNEKNNFFAPQKIPGKIFFDYQKKMPVWP